ncbi:MAG: PAS domain-containing protein [Actinobacteria bacterium]|nr:PAS domain-containing protein [Actinomycetota bacterium]
MDPNERAPAPRRRRGVRPAATTAAPVASARFALSSPAGLWQRLYDAAHRRFAGPARRRAADLSPQVPNAPGSYPEDLAEEPRPEDGTERRSAEERLLEAEARYRTLAEQLPVVVYTDEADDISTALYLSPRYEQLTGYTPEERLADPGLWFRILHPDDRQRVIELSRRTNETGEPFECEYRLIAKDGRVVWVRDHAVLVEGQGGSPGFWQGVLADVTGSKLTEDALARRDRILEASGYAAERFLNAASWTHPIDEVLARLGQASGTSRACVFENALGNDGELFFGQRSEWVARPDLATIGDESLQLLAVRREGYARWEELLGRGEAVHGPVRDFPPGERPNLERRSILSLCVVPVFVAGEWWGMIGVDQCDEERRWKPAEIDAIRVVANTLGAAIGRERAERRLSETEARYRTLVEQIPAITYMEDPATGRPFYISPQLETVLGYTRQEWDAGAYRRNLHPDDRDRVLAEDARTNETGEPYRVQFRLRAKDGRWVWLRDQAVLIRDDHGNPLYWQGVRFDVTAEKEVEQQLREAERRYRVLVEQMPAITYVDGPPGQGRTMWVSPQVEAFFGYTPEEWLQGRLWFERLHPQDRERVIEADRRCDLTGEPFREEYRILHRDGHPVWVRDESVLARDEEGNPAYRQGVYHDITARKEAEQQLHDAEERYRSLVETIPAAIYIDTAEDLSKAVYMSPQVEQIFGYSPEEWRANPHLWEEGVHPDDREETISRVERLNVEGATYEAEYRFRNPERGWVWVHDQAVLIRDYQGRPRFSQGVMFDITQRKAAEQQLREAEERFRAIVEHVPAAIYLDTPDEHMRTIYVSPQIEAITGVAPTLWRANEEIWLERMNPEDRERVIGSYLEAVAAQLPWSAEYRIVRPDGSEVWVHDETTFLHDDLGNPTHLQGVLFDITEQKLAERALRDSEQREREAAEGLRALDEMKNTFLAAVSHELRSPLTSILGLSITLERQAGTMREGDRSDLLGRLSSNARKLDRLLTDLLDIDRLNRGIVTPRYRVTDVGALVRRTLDALEALADRTVEVEIEAVTLPVDPAKVERIVENLLVNAAPHTGRDDRIWVRVRPGEGGVMISVDDEGPGVPEELRAAIFEPFRQGPTASKSSPGTGIGLSLVARFAQLHGGRAWVQAREGGGASFRVYLPAGRVDAGVAGGGPGGHVEPVGDGRPSTAAP